MKKCCRCEEEKPLKDFHKDKSKQEGVASTCKECKSAYDLQYRIDNKEHLKELSLKYRNKNKHNKKRYDRKRYRTKEGFLKNTYNSMQARVEGRQENALQYTGLPIVRKKEFLKWALSHSDFNYLFDRWVENNFNTVITPSIDRIHPEHGYDFINMQWVTKSENSTRANIWRYHGVIV